MERITRSYLLRAYPNPGKAEEYRYAMWWYRRYFLHFASRRFFQPEQKVSTVGLGRLGNRASKRAWDCARGLMALRRKGFKVSPPADLPPLVDGMVRRTKGSTFDFWGKAPTCAWIPAKSHAALNRALEEGRLRDACEIVETSKGFFLRVFVEFDRPESVSKEGFLGCDVGVNNGVARSDGYLSKSLRPIMARQRFRNAERQRQGHRTKSNRSAVRQFLDTEARRAVTLAASEGKTLVLEAQRQLANLRPRGSIGAWARRHFGGRVRQIAELAGVSVREVWPAYSSRECWKCGHSDRTNRRGKHFRCVRCGYVTDADISAARVLTLRATL